MSNTKETIEAFQRAGNILNKAGYSFCSEKNDPVNKPSHYQLLPGVEVIDVRDAIFDKMPVDVPHDVADCWSRSWEYLTRMWGKNGLEDAKKARFYLDRMIQKLEGGE